MVFLLLFLSDVCCSDTFPYIWSTNWMIVGNHLKKSLVATSIEFIAVSGGCRAKDTGNSGVVAVSSSGGANGGFSGSGGLLGGSRLSRAGGMAGVGGPSVINGDIWLGNRIWAFRWPECSIEQITRSIEQITWSILTISRSIELIN